MMKSSAPTPPLQPNERLIVFLIASVQFINILEFMMVMPLGPDFSRSLGIPMSDLGKIGGAYTAAAAVSGLVSSLFLERFDRRKALAWFMAGLVLSTILCGLANDLPTLLMARVLAGAFGGPATALSLAVVADTIPFERRGKAMGTVMSSFAVASVLGVPAGLELARLGPWGWRTPFFAVSALGMIVVALSIWKLPPIRAHLDFAAEKAARGEKVVRTTLLELLQNPMARLSFVMTFFLMSGMFMLIPNIAGYVQGNLGYPREDMGRLYLYGGIGSFLTMNLVGKAVDRYGAFPLGLTGSVVMVLTMYFGFVIYPPPISVVVIFLGFMMSSSARNVPFNTLTSQVPRLDQRARFMSIQAAVQHIAASGGAFVSSALLSEHDGKLDGIVPLTYAAIAASSIMPILLWYLQKGVLMRRAESASIAAASQSL